jgi:hypothetical protein
MREATESVDESFVTPDTAKSPDIATQGPTVSALSGIAPDRAEPTMSTVAAKAAALSAAKKDAILVDPKAVNSLRNFTLLRQYCTSDLQGTEYRQTLTHLSSTRKSIAKSPDWPAGRYPPTQADEAEETEPHKQPAPNALKLPPH